MSDKAPPDDTNPPAKDGAYPPIIPPSLPARWSKAFGAATAPFADPARVDVMVPALAGLLAAGATVRFSNHSGIVRTLRGQLRDSRVTSEQEALSDARDFLQEHRLALFGSDQERWYGEDPTLIGSAVYFRQVDRDGIPVYGALVACDYDLNGQLRMLTSTWYPLPKDAGGRDKFHLPWEHAANNALTAIQKLLEEELQTLSDEENEKDRPFYERAIAELRFVPGSRLEEGRVIAPVLLPPGRIEEAEPRTGSYRAAWVIRVLDRVLYRSWEVLIDAESDSGDVIGIALAAHHLTLKVFLTNDAVGQNSTQLSSKTVDLPTVTPALDIADLRQSNVYYHLTRAAERFETVVQQAWPVQPRRLDALPGRLNGRVLTVSLSGSGTGIYDPGDIRNVNDGTIRFGTGQNNPPVLDPTLDREAIYHEYTHAVIDAVQPDIVDKNQPELFRFAINEGLAFYFACTLAEREQPSASAPYRWGDYAFGQNAWTQRATRDLQREAANQQHSGFDYISIYGSFPRYTNLKLDEPLNLAYYACGMLWARALWDIHRVLDSVAADAAVLRSLPLISGVQTELETAAEAIIHAEEVLAGLAGGAHENALGLIFCSRGIMADTPVGDLRAGTIGGQPYLLAAVEGSAASQSGCLISQDGGVSWKPLGVNGPNDVSMLTVAQLTQNDAVVLAATDGMQGSGPSVYSYNLGLVGGQIDRTRGWTQLPALPAAVGILALAAMPQPGGGYWVFAGVERGLYRSDGAAWTQVAISPTRPIRSLALLTMPQGAAQPAVLLATGALGTFAIDPPQLTQPAAFNVTALPSVETLAVAAGGPGAAWIGTWDGQVMQFDAAGMGTVNGPWTTLPSLPGQRPIYRLLADSSGAPPMLYAGTNDGVWWRQIGLGDASWQRLVGNADANFDGCAVVALERSGSDLFAGTLERGIWRRNLAAATAWERLASSLPRLGRSVDAEVLPGGVAQISSTRQLAAGQRAIHIVHVPAGGTSMTINLQPNGAAAFNMYYVAPYTDLGHQPPFAAGLAQKQPNSGVIAPVDAGYYLLVIIAQQDLASYTLSVTIA